MTDTTRRPPPETHWRGQPAPGRSARRGERAAASSPLFDASGGHPVDPVLGEALSDALRQSGLGVVRADRCGPGAYRPRMVRLAVEGAARTWCGRPGPVLGAGEEQALHFLEALDLSLACAATVAGQRHALVLFCDTTVEGKVLLEESAPEHPYRRGCGAWSYDPLRSRWSYEPTGRGGRRPVLDAVVEEAATKRIVGVSRGDGRVLARVLGELRALGRTTADVHAVRSAPGEPTGRAAACVKTELRAGRYMLRTLRELQRVDPSVRRLGVHVSDGLLGRCTGERVLAREAGFDALTVRTPGRPLD